MQAEVDCMVTASRSRNGRRGSMSTGTCRADVGLQRLSQGLIASYTIDFIKAVRWDNARLSTARAENGPFKDVTQAAETLPDIAGSADTWRFDVFISHAGQDKPFARELRTDINSLGLRAFVDVKDLLPGDQAHEIMLGSANSAPVGLAVFSSEFFRRKWPMRELRILVERKTLLPVLYANMLHDELIGQLQHSVAAAPPKQVWNSFVQEIERTTYLRCMEEYTGVLRQDLCWNVVRLLATKVCRTLPNTVRTGDFLDRVEKAAQIICDEARFEDLPRWKTRQAKEWIADVKAQRKKLIAA
ncbi:hypothetical protein WJX72_006246 [[Myrmecia] bisecta]|uniref:TIR domain-containing protein n=1 Tax=[Myrmecia] bisecta TaxID=41462 RepID=A0AAW1R791_9CHLO